MLPVLITILMAPLTLDVPGLTCPTCVKPVQKSLALMDGVNQVKIDWRSRKVLIDFDDKRTSEKAIRARLKDAGFSAVEAGKALKENASQDYLTITDTAEARGSRRLGQSDDAGDLYAGKLRVRR